MTRKEKLEKRAEVIAKARQINDKYSDDSGVLPAEHQEQFDNAMQEAADLKASIDRDAALETAETELRQRIDSIQIDPTAKPDGASDPEMVSLRVGTESGQAVYRDCKAGQRGTREYQNAVEKALVNGASGLSPQEFAALRSDDADQAGYLVASEQLAAGILKGVDDLVFVRQHARVHTVREATSLGIRKRTAKANTFDWSSELAVSTEDSTLAYGKKVLTPQHLTGQIKVSRDLLRRTAGTAESEVRMELARDAAETMETAYFTGSGAQQPLGVFTASADGISTGRDIQTGSSTNFTADGILEAKYTLKQQYRNGGPRGGARWLFHRDGISLLARLQDGDSHYLLQPGRGLTGDEFDTLVGYPVDESELAPNTFTTGQYVGILANWQYYEIADALDLEIQVLTELYAATNQVGYIGRLKTDGMPTLEEAFVRLITN